MGEHAHAEECERGAGRILRAMPGGHVEHCALLDGQGGAWAIAAAPTHGDLPSVPLRFGEGDHGIVFLLAMHHDWTSRAG